MQLMQAAQSNHRCSTAAARAVSVKLGLGSASEACWHDRVTKADGQQEEAHTPGQV
jgi:hypothetical protein